MQCILLLKNSKKLFQTSRQIHQKILNLLNEASDSKFSAKKWNINDQRQIILKERKLCICVYAKLKKR